MRNWCVYKTVDLKTKEFYIGKSKASKVNKGYQGSGLWVKNNKNPLITGIIAQCDTEDQAYYVEYCVINKYLSSDKCKNLIKGGRLYHTVGSDNVAYKIDPSIVFDIRQKLMNGSFLIDLSREYKLSKQYCANVMNMLARISKEEMPQGYEDWYYSGNYKNKHRHSTKKLTNYDAFLIRKMIQDKNISQAEIARRFNVNPACITYIKKGKTYNQEYLFP